MANSVPTERQVLRCIFDMYEGSFPVEGPSVGKTMIAIDIDAVARKLRCDKNILFGYLYYHLDQKYRYSTGENRSVHLFIPVVGELRNAVNLPYLTAVLAAQEQEHSKFAWSLGVSLSWHWPYRLAPSSRSWSLRNDCLATLSIEPVKT